MSDVSLAHLDEIEEASDGRCPWRPVRQHMGVSSFGINAFTAREAGDRIINEHVEAEDEQEELYFVHRGRAVFELDGERRDAPAGTFVFVPRGVNRTAFAEEPETTLIAIGGTPGKAFEPPPPGWEGWAPLQELYESGQYAEAAERGRAILENHPEYTLVAYNVACCESLAGRPDEAIEHLRSAVEDSDYFRTLAARDADLDPIRDHPAFDELVPGPSDTA